MEELSLKWDEHHPAVISVFEELLAKGTLVDCTIAADGQYVKAHKVVLAACSPYFELLFSQEAEKNPIVVLKDMKFQELKHLIDFVYRGQVKLPKAQLDAFVSAAETLQIKGLSGQQTKKISERFANNANKTVSSREGCSSPVPRKRRRSSYTETNEDSQSEPGNESSSDSNMRENFIPTPIPLGVPSTSTASSSTGISSHSASSQQSRSLTETRFPSHDQPSASPEQVLPDVQTVVKTEPEEPTEPLAQVFFPEPKNEEYVDDLAMLESGAGSSDMQGGTSQENTNNYPGYDSSGDTFLMNQMADQNTSSGGEPLSPLDDKALSVVNLLVLQRHGSQPPPPQPPPLRLDALAALPALGAPSLPRVFPEVGVAGRVGGGPRPRPQPPRHEWRYACRVCRKPFRTPALVARHMRTHTGERPYACAECGFTFKEMSHLRVHARKHALGAGAAAAPRRCDACGGVFRREEHLKQHRCGRALAGVGCQPR